MSDNNSIVLEAIISIAASVGGGTLLGYYLSGRNEKQRQANQIAKVKELVNDDLSRIHQNTTVRRAQITSTTPEQLDNLTNQIFDAGGIVGRNIASMIVNFRMLHWDTLVSSGLLVELETVDIRELQALYNFLEDSRNNLLPFYNNSTHNMVIAVRSANSEIVRKQTIHIQLSSVLDLCSLTYGQIIERIQRITESINWIRLDDSSINDGSERRMIIDSHGSWELR